VGGEGRKVGREDGEEAVRGFDWGDLGFRDV
jgi:hypothetical protein